MMTTDRMDRIVIDITMGRKPKPADDEEKRFIDKVSSEIADGMKKGHTPEVPSDWPKI